MVNVNLGLIELDLTLLAELIDLPQGCVIEAVFEDPGMNVNHVVLRVRGPGMPFVAQGCAIPTVIRYGGEWR